MHRVSDETRDILKSLIDDDPHRDLHEDPDGNGRQLFSTYLEIFLMDIYVDSRILLATLEESDALLEKVREKSKLMSAEENEAAGRFTGAIASIMLVPTFIVGVYGQNFDFPEKNWQYGYLMSWGSIILLTAFQITFFKRRRWI